MVDGGESGPKKPEFQLVRTRRSTEHRIVILLAGVACIQLALNAVEYFLGDFEMMLAWSLCALAVAGGTVRIESHKLKRERWSAP